MAYNTVAIKKDVDGKPIPQFYNPITNQYEVLEGLQGASRTVLYDNDGNPIDIVVLITDIINILNAKNLPNGASTKVKQDELISTIDSNSQEVYANTRDILALNSDRMNPKTYYLLSTETKPKSTTKGETVFEIDTSEVYMWNGTSWVVI